LNEELEAQAEITRLREALRREQRRNSDLITKREDLVRAVYQAASDGYLAIGKPPAVPKPRKDARPNGEEVALIHATDWQRGKETENYSSEICDARIELFVDKIQRITSLHRKIRPIRRAVVMDGGDMLENIHIFPGQEREVDSSAYGQLFGLVDLKKRFYRRLASDFEQVDVYDVEGNHGRIGRPAEWPRTDNLDLIATEITRRELASEKRIVWHPRKQWYQRFEIGAYVPMLVHGDQIKSFGGNLPSYGIVRRAIAWASGVVPNFTDLYMGHFHQIMRLPLPNGGTVFVTGSPESGNEYAREFIGGTGAPSQRLNFVDPEVGRLTAEYVIYLDEITDRDLKKGAQ